MFNSMPDQINEKQKDSSEEDKQNLTTEDDESFFAIIAQSDATELSKILKYGHNVKKIKQTDSLKRLVYASTNYENIDLVFVDFDVFRDKSIYFLEKVKDHINCKNIKFILLGTTSTKSLLLKAANAGYSSFITKPFDKADVLQRISKILPLPEKSSPQRLSLLENIEATLQYKNKEAIGSIEDIGIDGCLISIPYFDRLKIEVYDVITIRVEVDNDKFGVNAEVVKVEKQDKIGFKAVSIYLQFTQPDHKTALDFAKLWAYILHD